MEYVLSIGEDKSFGAWTFQWNKINNNISKPKNVTNNPFLLLCKLRCGLYGYMVFMCSPDQVNGSTSNSLHVLALLVMRPRKINPYESWQGATFQCCWSSQNAVLPTSTPSELSTSTTLTTSGTFDLVQSSSRNWSVIGIWMNYAIRLEVYAATVWTKSAACRMSRIKLGVQFKFSDNKLLQPLCWIFHHPVRIEGVKFL